MTFRGDVEAVQARVDALEETLAERERELEALDRLVAEREAALAAELPKERHLVRVRQLEAAITETEREVASARADAARRASPGERSPEAARLRGLGWVVAVTVGLVGLFWLLVTR